MKPGAKDRLVVGDVTGGTFAQETDLRRAYFRIGVTFDQEDKESPFVTA
jgi:hypothetical protein